jgi:hypothetical protein
MSKWKKVIANSNLVQHATERAVLIKIPKSKLKFWHPKKCVRFSGKNSYLMSISYNDDFTFTFFRNGEGKQSQYEKIEEFEGTASDLENYFKN